MALIHRIKNLKIVASKVGRQVFLVCCCVIVYIYLKGKCEACATKPVPEGFPEVYCINVICVVC